MKRNSIFQLQDECFLLLLESSLKSIPFNVLLSTLIWGYLLYRHAPIVPATLWWFSIGILSLTRWINNKKNITNKNYILRKIKAKNNFLLLTFLTYAFG